MSTLKRWFSPTYRHALALEAEGRYIEAARAYALCAERPKVAEMHLLEAERRGAPASAIRELQVAANFLRESDAAAPETRALFLRLGRAYLKALRKSTLAEADRELCAEAARLLRLGGDAEAAAEAFSLSGDLERAAAAYQEAGVVEKVESLLAHEAALRTGESRERDAIETYRVKLALGQRREALAALRDYAVVAKDAAEGRRLLDELLERRLGSRIRLTLTDERAGASRDLVYTDEPRIVLGRDPAATLVLADPTVGARHLALERRPDEPGSFEVTDLGSLNGTTLAGLRIAGTLPLRGSGELGVGQVRLAFTVTERGLRLVLGRGKEQGLELHAEPGPFALLDSGLALAFDGEGEAAWPVLTAAPGRELLLNGRRVATPVELLRGDVLSAGGYRFEVR